ncbi:hypothetical protein HK098_000575 [Nowakowskiella sp. JEL0407]|nr:hypothetical protein HK098_000575 [Nowakowskiella sp. JEL0407]
MPLLSTLAVPNNIDLELLPTSCEDLQDIPSRDHIKSLMKFHSNVSGMPQEPSEGSYDLMLRALQSHLKSLLSSTITKTRSHSISSFSPSIQSELSSLSSSSKQSLSGPPLKLDPNITASSPQPHIQQVYNNSNHPSHLSNGVGASSSIFTNPTALTNNINNNITNSSNSSSSSSSSSSSTTNIIVNGKSSHQSLGLDELSFSLDLAPQLVRSWPAVKIKEKVLAGLDME